MLRAILVAVWAVIAAGCTAIDGDSRVFVASTPQGADILIDDRPTGLTTPAMVDLDGFFGSDHRITLQLAGRDPETRWVRHHHHYGFSRWVDGAEDSMLNFTWPIWWTLPDLFLPFKAAWKYFPHEVHAVLYEAGKGPVTEPAPAQ